MIIYIRFFFDELYVTIQNNYSFFFKKNECAINYGNH